MVINLLSLRFIHLSRINIAHINPINYPNSQTTQHRTTVCDLSTCPMQVTQEAHGKTHQADYLKYDQTLKYTRGEYRHVFITILICHRSLVDTQPWIR